MATTKTAAPAEPASVPQPPTRNDAPPPNTPPPATKTPAHQRTDDKAAAEQDANREKFASFDHLYPKGEMKQPEGASPSGPAALGLSDEQAKEREEFIKRTQPNAAFQSGQKKAKADTAYASPGAKKA